MFYQKEPLALPRGDPCIVKWRIEINFRDWVEGTCRRGTWKTEGRRKDGCGKRVPVSWSNTDKQIEKLPGCAQFIFFPFQKIIKYFSKYVELT